jgi:predicted enzyme related to lactoylglutathione lyase
MNPTRTGLRAQLIWSAAVLLTASASFAGGTPELPPLTTVSSNARLPGKFVWADLVTDDVQAAQNFYAGLFGWTFRNVGNYVVAFNDERPLAGMFQRARPANDAKARPRWFGYISVGNVEKVQSAVTKNGGRELAAPRKMPKRGEQAVFADAEGAVFGVVKSSTGDPQDFQAEPGDWIWIQLLSHDAKQAADFYRDVAGYEVIENTASNRLSDFVLASQGFARATVREIPKARQAEIKPNWLPFVRVKSISESVAKAEQLHGKILLAPKPERFEGKVAVVADPTGGAIGLMEWSGNAEKGVK